MGLQEYHRKRDFKKTREPHGKKQKNKEPIFVVQKHWASHVHYDFRLEAFGVLKSWAVPKGPSSDPHDKRLAVEVEDHPISYARFQGSIPKGQYGGGEVKIWDHGTWKPRGDVKEGLRKGHLDFELRGKKLKGQWVLQRIRSTASGKNQWLLIKKAQTSSVSPSEKEISKPPSSPESLQGALVPKMALLQKEVPEGPRWIYETKYDGYRTLAVKNLFAVHMLTRNGLDWSAKYPELIQKVSRLKGARQAVFDGEIVCLNSAGQSSFPLLQEALSRGHTDDFVYFVFDLLFLNGRDLRGLPLRERKALLRKILSKNKSQKIRYSPHAHKEGRKAFQEACRQGLEGIVAKDQDQVYRGGRESDWVKVKCSLRQEFVIGGYTDPEGARTHFGALLMGAYEKGRFRYCGKVGTGFDSRLLKDIWGKLKKIEIDASPFQELSPRAKGIHWVAPRLVAEIEFKSFTRDHLIRQGSFQGLRLDKKATEVHLEAPKLTTAALPKESPPTPAPSHTAVPLSLTHPRRLIYPREKISKQDVFDYYMLARKWMLPHLQSRPLALFRCTGQGTKTCFFQRHPQTSAPGVGEAVVNYHGKHEKFMTIEEAEGLFQLIQGGAVEFHTSGTHVDHLLQPDLIVFDLDPHEKVPWSTVTKTALVMKKDLEKLGLKSFLKVTGGKGLHLHIPIQPRYNWEQILSFAKVFVDQMAEANPDLYLTKAAKTARTGKIFLDYLRNGFGATAVAPYSLRAKEKSSVAFPISWRELKHISGADVFSLKEAVKILKTRRSDPWKDYFKHPPLIKILERRYH